MEARARDEGVARWLVHDETGDVAAGLEAQRCGAVTRTSSFRQTADELGRDRGWTAILVGVDDYNVLRPALYVIDAARRAAAPCFVVTSDSAFFRGVLDEAIRSLRLLDANILFDGFELAALETYLAELERARSRAMAADEGASNADVLLQRSVRSLLNGLCLTRELTLTERELLEHRMHGRSWPEIRRLTGLSYDYCAKRLSAIKRKSGRPADDLAVGLVAQLPFAMSRAAVGRGGARPKHVMDRLGIPAALRAPVRSRLLVVDDHRTTCRRARAVLGRDVRVFAAHDRDGADRWLGQGLSPNGVYVDEVLTEADPQARWSGFVVVERVRRQDGLLPVLLSIDPRHPWPRAALSNALLRSPGEMPKIVKRPKRWDRMVELARLLTGHDHSELPTPSTASPQHAQTTFEDSVARTLGQHDLTAAPRAVVLARARGCTWDEVARERGTKRRTVRRQASFGEHEAADDAVLATLATAARDTASVLLPARP